MEIAHMRFVFLTLMAAVLLSKPAAAQFAAQNDAKYIAALKAVVNYKIDDEENINSKILSIASLESVILSISENLKTPVCFVFFSR